MDDPKPCIFCGEARKRSREHIWPQWISAMFPGDGHFHYARYNADGTQDALWTAPKFNHTIRAVCKVCNEGWMGGLEGLIRPLLEPAIQGNPVEFDPVEQRGIAVWALKMAMVFDYAHEEPRRAFTAEERFALATAAKIPEGSAVWLAAYQGRSLVWYRSHDLGMRREDEPDLPPTEGPNAHTTTFVVGHLAFRVWKLPDLKGGGITVPVEHQAFVQMIHPQTDLVRVVIRWPPRLSLDDEALRAFSEYFYG